MVRSYPKLYLRIKAMLWDSVVLWLLFLLLAFLTSYIPIKDKTLQFIILIALIISFEPLLTYFTGQTIGHRVSGIRIIDKKTNRSLNVFQCYVRFISKSTLGTLSLIMFVFSRNYQAIHDYLSGSLVVFDNENSIPQQRKLTTQRNTFIDKKPSFSRRLIVMITLIFLTLIIQSLIINISVSANCLNYNECTSNEENLFTYSGLFLLLVFGLIVVLGLICKLPGAYYKSRHQIE